MKAEDLVKRVSLVGNDLDDGPKPRVISFHDYVLLPFPEGSLLPGESPDLILKFYLMQERGSPVPTEGDIREATGFLQYQYNMEEALSGLGFAVLSDGILNVCKWHNEYSDVIVPGIFTWNKEDFRWLKEKIESAGAFCSGEKAVYDHENAAWLRYLRTDRNDSDKVRYLLDVLPSGRVAGEA